MKRLLVVLVALAATAAGAVPPTMPFAGRLSTSGGPVSGTVAITFRLFAAPTGGAPVWSETHPAVTVTDGLVYAELGTLTSLDVAVLNGQPRYLELAVGTETLSPRIALASLPYAFRADTCEHLGPLAEPDVQRRVAGTCGANAAIRAIDETGQVACTSIAGVTAGPGIAVNGAQVSLSTAGCGAGFIWKYSGSSFSCVPDEMGPTYSAGAGITLAGNAVGLSTQGCPANGVWHYSGSAWSCSADAITTDANALTSGTVSTTLYSAYADLNAEGYLDANAGGDLLTQGQGDGRYLNASGDTATGNLSAPDFRYGAARTGYASVASMAFVGDFWHHTGFGESFPSTVGVNSFGTAGVTLPNGATVTGFRCVVVDSDATHHITVTLRRVWDSGDTAMASVTTTDAQVFSTWTTLTAASITGGSVDNNTYAYYLELFGNQASAAQVGLRRCVVTYTTPGPTY